MLEDDPIFVAFINHSLNVAPFPLMRPTVCSLIQGAETEPVGKGEWGKNQLVSSSVLAGWVNMQARLHKQR